MRSMRSEVGGRTSRLALLAGLAAILACSSAGGSGTTSGSALAPRRGSANLITAQEIAAAGNMENAYEVVERLRPQMMRSRASTFGATRSDGTQGGESINVVAFLDEVRLGDVTTLRSVPATQVLEIRYISATDATQRWGTGFGSGAIQVISKK